MFVSGIQENGKNVEDNQPKRGMIGDCDCGCSTSVAQTEEDFALYRKAVERLHADFMYRLLEWAFAYDDGSGLPDAGAYAAELKNVTATADGKPVQGFDPTKTGTWTIPAGTQVNIVDMPDESTTSCRIVASRTNRKRNCEMTGNGCTASEPPLVREWANRPITSAKEWREYLEAYQEETRRRTKELKFGFSPYRSVHIPH